MNKGEPISSNVQPRNDGWALTWHTCEAEHPVWVEYRGCWHEGIVVSRGTNRALVRNVNFGSNGKQHYRAYGELRNRNVKLNGADKPQC